MQLHNYLYTLLALSTTAQALALPAALTDLPSTSKDLFKRKGGGGGGGGGGRGGGSSSSSSSSSSGSRGGSSSSGSSSSSSGSRGSSSSSTTSGSRSGSGSSSSSRTGTSAPRYGGGGGYYGGGATTPYRSGIARAGVAPILLGGAALGALAVLPGVWLYGAYAYNFNGPYSYYNRTANRNESHPITCLCGENADCGCDPNNNQQYLDDVANNGDVARLATVNGTQRLVVNGTVDEEAATGAAGMLQVPGVVGYLPVIAGVAYSVLLLL